jgi:catechol 2,3-dioxygenase-like lactoylglutathione lyase family enzyme
MGVYLDHTIVFVKDLKKSIKFYCDILGFKHEVGKSKAFEIIRINNNLGFDLEQADSVQSQHFAFCMDRVNFDSIFERVKKENISYGDNYPEPENMKGLGQAPGTRGMADSVYFYDPSGHLLEIRNYSGD